MAFHKGITSTAGLTLPAGAIAQSVDETDSVEISEVAGTSGEWVKASPLRQKKKDATIGGVGPADLSTVTAANVDPPSTMKILSVEQGEKSTGDNRATFVINATGMIAFDETAEGEPDDAGDGAPDEDTLGIVSITLSLSETLSVKADVKDLNAPATDGTPGARATVGVKNTISQRGKGDIPASLTLGYAGIAVAGMDGGLTIVRQLMRNQKAQEINGYGSEANNYPVAA